MRPAALLLQRTMRRQMTRRTYTGERREGGREGGQTRPSHPTAAATLSARRCHCTRRDAYLAADAGAVSVVHHAECVTALGKVEEYCPYVGPGVDQKETKTLLRGVAASEDRR